MWGLLTRGTDTLSPNHTRADASAQVGQGPIGAGADDTAENAGAAPSGVDANQAVEIVLASLEDDKAEDIQAIDIRGKSSIADMLVVASGRSQRHVGALADHLIRKLKEAGAQNLRVEGMPSCDWVLVDAGDLIVHLFRPEVRSFYNIEKIWSGAPSPGSAKRV